MSRTSLTEGDDIFWNVVQRCVSSLYEASSLGLRDEEVKEIILKEMRAADRGWDIVKMCEHAFKMAAEYYSGVCEDCSITQRDETKAIALFAVIVRFDKIMNSKEKSELKQIIYRSKKYFCDMASLREEAEKVISEADCTALPKEMIMTVIDAMYSKNRMEFGGSFSVIEKIIERSEVKLGMVSLVELYQRLVELFSANKHSHEDEFPKVKRIISEKIKNKFVSHDMKKAGTAVESDYKTGNHNFDLKLRGIRASKIRERFFEKDFNAISEDDVLYNLHFNEKTVIAVEVKSAERGDELVLSFNLKPTIQVVKKITAAEATVEVSGPSGRPGVVIERRAADRMSRVAAMQGR